MKTAAKLVAGLLVGIFLLLSGLVSFLSFSPSKELSPELQQLQQELGFALSGGAGWFAPCEYIELTSPFGWRINPVTGEPGNFHNGVDLANDEGTPIYAARKGSVLQVGTTGPYGNHVRIDHGEGTTTLYAHMIRFVVEEGQQVSGGQVIGYMGSTGNSTGNHLHFSVFTGGAYVDPMIYISEASLPREAAQRQIFQFLTGSMGMSPAAACGVLANMEKESDFDPHALGDYGTSYGLCQWHDTSPGAGRWTNLKNYCRSNGLDDTTLDGQLAFLAYELQTYYPGLLTELKNTPDTSDGAYDAAYAWCTRFERPANMEQEGALRGQRAVSVYWPKFKDS